MAATFGSWDSNQTAAAASITVNKPTGVVSGSLLIVRVGGATTGITWTAPSGDGGAAWSSAVATTGRGATFYKIANGSEPSTYTFSRTGGGGTLRITIDRWSGHDTTTPIQDSAGSDVTTANAVSPAVTAGSGGGLLSCGLVCLGSNTNSPTQPTGMTQDYVATTTAFRSEASLAVSSGSTSTKTWTSALSTTYTSSVIINTAATTADASLAETVTLTATAQKGYNTDATLAETVTLGASATKGRPADASLAETVTLDASATKGRPADGTLAETVTLTAAAVNASTIAATALAETVTLDASALRDARTSGDLALTTTLNATASAGRRPDAALATVVTLTADAQLDHSAAANLALTTTLTAAGVVPSGADLPTTVSLPATAVVGAVRATDALAAAVTLTATAVVGHFADANLTLDATLNASSRLDAVGDADLALTVELTARMRGRVEQHRATITDHSRRTTVTGHDRGTTVAEHARATTVREV